MAELLTELEKQRRARDIRVAETFKAMRDKYPGAAPSRIMREMAARKCQGLTSYCGVRSSLIRLGVDISK